MNKRPDPRQIKYSEYLPLIDKFRLLYKELNIDISADSFLQKTIDNVIAMTQYTVVLKGDYIEIPFTAEELRAIAFFPHILDSIDKIYNLPNREILKNHLVLLTLAKFSQNDYNDNVDWSHINKVWELMIIIALIEIGADIIYVGDPFYSGSKSKVDIIAKINNITWGIECKVPTTSELKPKSFMDLIGKGVEQIISTAEIDYGIVCLNMRNLIHHNNYLKSPGDNLYTYYPDLSIPDKMLKREMNFNMSLLDDNLNKIVSQAGWQRREKKIKYLKKLLFDNNQKVSLGWFNYYSTTALIYHNHRIAIDFIQILNPQGIDENNFDKEHKLSNKINNGLFRKEE